MKYRIGEKVIVRPDLEGGKMYNNVYFVEPGMSHVKGRCCTIAECNASHGIYKLKECENFIFSEEMLLPFVQASLDEIIDFLNS